MIRLIPMRGVRLENVGPHDGTLQDYLSVANLLHLMINLLFKVGDNANEP